MIHFLLAVTAAGGPCGQTALFQMFCRKRKAGGADFGRWDLRRLTECAGLRDTLHAVVARRYAS